MDLQLMPDESPNQLRLLYLLPFAPRTDATNGGSRAIGQLLSEMVAHHKVALFYLRSPNEPPLGNEIREKCELVEEVVRPWGQSVGLISWIRNFRLIASLLFLARPMWVTDWASNDFRRRLRQFIHKWPADVVLFEFHVMGQYLTEIKETNSPKILTIHEPGTNSAPYLKRLNPGLNRLVDALDKAAWRRFERSIIPKFQALVVFTGRDREIYKAMDLGIPIWKIPLGTIIPDQPLDALGNPPLCLLFYGNFLHPPNIDAAKRLINSIFPQVKREFPDLILYIVGDHLPAELQKKADDNIVIPGRVPNLFPYLDRAALVVAPLYQGGGMRIKVLEALAAGKAVVATPLAVEGLEVTDGEQVALAEDDDEFAGQVLHLLNNAGERAKLGQQAYAWAKEHAGWEGPIKAYDRLCHSLLVKRPGE
jgi:glycosyltransferase involved in cell wall biosynthesis